MPLASALEPLGEQARALTIMPDDLDEIAPASAEHEQMPRVRIVLQRLLNEKRQARKAAPHIGVTGREPDPNTSGNGDHTSSSSAAAMRFQRRQIDVRLDPQNASIRQHDFDHAFWAGKSCRGLGPRC